MAEGLFNHMQEALRHVEGKRVSLTRGVHQALADFRCLVEDLSKRPTRLSEIIPLQPTLDGYHNAPGYMCGGALIPGPKAVPRTHQLQPSAAATSPEPTGAHPIVWRARFPADITAQLVSWVNQKTRSPTVP